MQWSHWFAGMMDMQPDDRMYNCLPMYHSVGGVQAPGAMLVAGGLGGHPRKVFRAASSGATLSAGTARCSSTSANSAATCCIPSRPGRRQAHRIRLACGNGLAPEVWDAFKDRFRHSADPRVLRRHRRQRLAVQRAGQARRHRPHPRYLAHRFAPALVAFDVETGEPVRDGQGFCVRCAADQTGEALGQDRCDDPRMSAAASRATRSQEARRRRSCATSSSPATHGFAPAT